MAKAYSMDLRERVVRQSNGTACRVGRRRRALDGISTAIDWVAGIRETGNVAAEPIGGLQPKKIVGQHREWLLGDAGGAPSPCEGWSRELADRGLPVDYRMVWAFVHRRSSLTKKDADCQRARSSRRGAATSAMDGLSESHRSGPSGLHRRDLDQDQHGAIARLEPPRSGECQIDCVRAIRG